MLRTSFSRDGAVLHVHLDGELDLATAPELLAAVARHLEPGVSTTVVDLGATTVVDLAGLRGLLDLHDRGRSQGFELRLASVPPLTRRLIELMADPALIRAASFDGSDPQG